MELNSYFQGLLSNIEPSPANVTVAKKAHENLRKKLREDEEISKADPDTYLSGSYARDTAIDDIKDVDVILLLDIDTTITTPDIVLGWVHATLQNHYDKTLLQGRSIQVTTDGDFQLDIVPGVAISRRDGPIRIPDRSVHEWVSTHPKGQITFAEERNKATNGTYIHFVKVMKHWRDRLAVPTSRIKSYILESLVAECVLVEPASYAQGVVSIMEYINQRCSAYQGTGQVPRIPDPGYPTVNVTKRWTTGEFDAFTKALKESLAIARLALQSTSEKTSMEQWRRLFGPKFSPKD